MESSVNRDACAPGERVPVPPAASGQERTSWRKSSHSEENNGNACVEVRFPRWRAVVMRDSVHPDSTEIPVPAEEWVSFIHQVKFHGF
ncbi:DUF397 domain-containing protein [Thermobifida halotolerans]|uniref:DUF397 domain-containing protein n=1 Tax=Thermobifida halotolerans TaxID=483545 RepID=A0AA97M1U2_9ACTN|nr:DUF397 domain-containing protein [Thermobifida halotolerans]UOE22203.1 DUF397 domain-containing protein [Thermobifida halotolerans]